MIDALRESKDLLVRRWGEMGGYWGISRTMAEIHALLFVTGEALCADDVMAQLHVSRGAASMNLRALVDWGLVRRAHRLGDRKEYFQADTDVWHMFETIMRERRRREIEPIVGTIDRCRELVAELHGADAGSAAEAREFRRRLDELHGFLTTMGALFELVVRFGSAGVRQFAELLTQTAAVADDAPAASARRPTGEPRLRGNQSGVVREPAANAPDRAVDSPARISSQVQQPPRPPRITRKHK
jgi:DNA-binding transcriptional regulator GbsR (MarR family)